MAPARVDASREVELELLSGGVRLLAGMDEVGRGALAGPVHVGVALVDAAVGEPPSGLRDSKMLSEARRRSLVPEVEAWAVDVEVGSASAAEVDEWGIVAALRLAGRRALAALADRGHVPDLVLLDGSHDWLTEPEPDLFAGLGAGADEGPDLPGGAPARVVTRVKADASCAVVAAASVCAKVMRDSLMADLEDAGYGWARNKGYASAEHVAGLERLGPSVHHRRSWNLPGVEAHVNGLGAQGAERG